MGAWLLALAKSIYYSRHRNVLPKTLKQKKKKS